MEMNTSSVLFNSLRLRASGYRPRSEDEASIYDRFQRISGADQRALEFAHVVLIGCGGLGGEVGHGLVRKGIGRLTLFDFDDVEWTNLPRQQFEPDDLGQNKALALTRQLARQATIRTLLQGYARSFQDAQSAGIEVDADVAVVGVDNNDTRIAAARYYYGRRTPVIFLAVDREASRGYSFVQQSQPGQACFLCLFPDASQDHRIHGCAGASIEILKIVAGLTLYAIDSLLMPRQRPWNFKTVFLDQGSDGHVTVGQRPRCPICS